MLRCSLWSATKEDPHRVYGLESFQPYGGGGQGGLDLWPSALGLLVQDFCRVLSELHDKAPVHKWEASKAAIETAFGLPVEQMFESIDHSAIASGSIAQVWVTHRIYVSIY